MSDSEIDDIDIEIGKELVENIKRTAAKYDITLKFKDTNSKIIAFDISIQNITTNYHYDLTELKGQNLQYIADNIHWDLIGFAKACNEILKSNAKFGIDFIIDYDQYRWHWFKFNDILGNQLPTIFVFTSLVQPYNLERLRKVLEFY